MSEERPPYNVANEEKALEWIIKMVLSSPDGDLIKESQCLELLDQITEWVERNDLQMGGGIEPLPEKQE